MDSEGDWTARMQQELAGYATRSDEGLDNFLGHIRHRLETARQTGVSVPENLSERVTELSNRRGWPPMR